MTNQQGSLRVALILQGVCVTILAMLICSIMLAVLIFISDWQETDSWLLFLNYTSIFIGGFYIGKRSQSKIWLNGAIIGVIYVLLIATLRTELSLLFTWILYKRVLVSGLIGALGSIIGGIFSQ